MMQEKNTHVGCAILRQNVGKKTQQFLACNYAYTNIVDKAVYRSGTAASACTTGNNSKYTSLCSTNESYAVNDLKKFIS